MKNTTFARRLNLTVVILTLFLISGSITAFAKTKNREAGNAKTKQSTIAHKALVARGKALFAANQCLDCHLVAGKGCVDGVSLHGIGKIRTEEFLTEQLRDPEEHVARAFKHFHGETNLMTSLNLTKSKMEAGVMNEILQTIEYADSNANDDGRASRRLLRETLGSCGLNNFENALSAVEEFLCNLELVDPEIGFGKATEALAMAALAFASIDVDHNERLSRNELSARAAHLDATGSQLMEWLLIHYDAIQRAGFAHHIKDISKADLLRASSFFTGLDTARLNFDSICGTQGRERKTLNHAELAQFIRGDGRALPPASRTGLIQLMHYLRNLELHGHPLGLHEHELSELTPEAIWKSNRI